MAGGISASPFLFPIRPSHGRHSSGTTGYLAEECDACRDALEMGLESQQEWFKRLTLVSNSMGPVTGIFQDGFLYACRLPAEMLLLIHTLLQFSLRCVHVPITNLPSNRHIIISPRYVTHYYSCDCSKKINK